VRIPELCSWTINSKEALLNGHLFSKCRSENQILTSNKQRNRNESAEGVGERKYVTRLKLKVRLVYRRCGIKTEWRWQVNNHSRGAMAVSLSNPVENANVQQWWLAGVAWFPRLRCPRSMLFKNLLVILSADRPFRLLDEPHSDHKAYTSDSIDRLQVHLFRRQDLCFWENYSLRLFFFYHLHNDSKWCRSHRRSVPLTILCGALIMRTTRPRLSYLFLLQQLVIWTIKILVRNYGMAWETR